MGKERVVNARWEWVPHSGSCNTKTYANFLGNRFDSDPNNYMEYGSIFSTLVIP